MGAKDSKKEILLQQESLDLLTQCSSKRMKVKEICKALEIPASTFHRMYTDYPEFKYVQPKRAPNCKVNYDKINYNDYCLKKKIDKGKNYHFYRENGYYNYKNAMNVYNKDKKNQGNINRYGFNVKPPENNIYKAMQFGKNKGPNIVNIKKK